MNMTVGGGAEEPNSACCLIEGMTASCRKKMAHIGFIVRVGLLKEHRVDE